MYHLLLYLLSLISIALLIGLPPCFGDVSITGLRLVTNSSRHLYALLDGGLKSVTSVDTDLLLWRAITGVPNFLLIGHVFIAVDRLNLPGAVAVLAVLSIVGGLALQEQHVGGLWRRLSHGCRWLVRLSDISGLIGLDFWLTYEVLFWPFVVHLPDLFLILALDDFKLPLRENSPIAAIITFDKPDFRASIFNVVVSSVEVDPVIEALEIPTEILFLRQLLDGSGASIIQSNHAIIFSNL